MKRTYDKWTSTLKIKEHIYIPFKFKFEKEIFSCKI